MERFPAIVVFYRLSEKLLFSWKLVRIGLYVMQKDVLSVYSSKHMFPIFDYLQISKHARYGFDRIEKKRKIKWKVRTSVFILPMRTLKLCIFAKRPQSVLWANINDFESIFSDFSFFIDYRKKDFFIKLVYICFCDEIWYFEYDYPQSTCFTDLTTCTWEAMRDTDLTVGTKIEK